jgi:serine protease Do
MIPTPALRVRLSIQSLVLLAVCVSLYGTTTAHAQRTRRAEREDSDVALKGDRRFLAAFHDVVAGPSRSTVRILCDNQETILGTIVGADGWILTKASELKGELTVRLPGGRERPARVVGISEPYDLAMLKIDEQNLVPVEWRDSKNESVGNWVVTSGPGPDAVAAGVLSVATRKISGAELTRRSSSGGFLGIRVASAKSGVKVAEVIAKSAASKAGFKEEDVIVAVAGKSITDPDSLFKALAKTRPGQTVAVKVKREEEEVQLRAKLDNRPMDRSDFQNQLGSKLSDRRTGFPVILQHDTVLRPIDCGGPLADLDGRVIGLNIARAGRTETYAIPAEAIRPLLKDLQSGKLAPTE